MPGLNRHVHFAPNAYPATPSPSTSHSSLPSSVGPITPPPLSYFGSPYACSPLPSMACRIHPTLSTTSSLLHYDVSFPSHTVQCHPSLPPHVLNEPATSPALQILTIKSPLLPRWSVEVKPSGKFGQHITVADVLDALYTSLRRSVAQAEFEKLPTSEARRSVTEFYTRRYQRIPDPRARAIEQAKGLKQVDFLGGRNIFRGLSSTTEGAEVWELRVS